MNQKIAILGLIKLALTSFAFGQSPSNLNYSKGVNFVYELGEPIEYNFFTYDGADATSVTISPALPSGITFVTDISKNEASMYGTPGSLSSATDHVVTVTNGDGSTSITINVAVEGSIKCVVEAGNVTRAAVPKGFASAVSCWLTDSAARRDVKPAFKKAGLGSLRYPYGHLADNYIWHDINAGDPMDGLKPVVASDAIPANWSWSTNPDGSFIDAMDFDEYMDLCVELDIQPLVVINILSHKYKDDNPPTLQHLIDTAVAWVQYAKDKNYEVAYWQIGNEIDHHRDIISSAQYTTAYHRVVDAMKAVDPGILTGPGILSNKSYMNSVVAQKSSNVNFLSAHQYMFAFDFYTYEQWRDHRKNLKPNVDNAISVSRSNGDIPVLVTETNARGDDEFLLGNKDNNWLKALCWFEHLIQQVHGENVAYSYLWGTTDPWSESKGGTPDDETSTLLLEDSSLSMRGEICKLVNDFLLNDMVKVDLTESRQRAYASVTTAKDRVNIFLLNKDKNAATADVSLSGMSLPEHYSVRQFSSDDPTSYEAGFLTKDLQDLGADSFSIELEPLSVTVVSFYPEKTFDTVFSYLLPEGDEDGNGSANYLEYAQGYEPGAGNISAGLEVDSSNALNYRVRKDASDVHYVLERSEDFIAWEPLILNQDYTEEVIGEDANQLMLKTQIDEKHFNDKKWFVRQSFTTTEPSP